MAENTQVIDSVQMIRVGMSYENGIETFYVLAQGLRAEIRPDINEKTLPGVLKQGAASKSFVVGIC